MNRAYALSYKIRNRFLEVWDFQKISNKLQMLL